jgi:hypothetical protein
LWQAPNQKFGKLVDGVFEFRMMAGEPGPAVLETAFRVHPTTRLPLSYEMSRAKDSSSPQLPIERLETSFDITIPEAVYTPPVAPNGYKVVDARTPLNTASTGWINGFRIEATPIARDANGNILVRTRSWIGDFQPSYDNGIQCYVSVENWSSSDLKNLPKDNRGRAYSGVQYLPLMAVPRTGEYSYALLAPVRPIPREGTPASSLELRFHVSASYEAPTSGRPEVHAGGSISSTNGSIRITLSPNQKLADLTAKIADLADVKPEEPVEAGACDMRGYAARRGVDPKQPINVWRPNAIESATWFREGVRVTKSGAWGMTMVGNRLAQYMSLSERIARSYESEGNVREARRWYKQALNEAKRFPRHAKPWVRILNSNLRALDSKR